MYVAYHILAKELGLRLAPEPGMMTFSFNVSGELDGHPVDLRRTCGRVSRVDITSPVHPHLDLGFALTRSGVVSRVSEWLGKQDIQMGDPEFDKAFTIKGDEPDRVRALLTPDVRQVILSLTATDFELTDAEYSMGYRLSLVTETSTRMAHELREAVGVARALGARASALPPAAALLAHHEAWTAYARTQQGFEGGSTPLWMQGKLGKAWVLARASRNRANDFSLELAARLERPLEVRLRVEPQRSLLDGLVGGVDQKTGDARFDEVFDVTQAATSVHLLNDELRRNLLDLSRLGPVTLFDSQLTVRTPATLPPGQLPGILEQLCAALAILEKNAGPNRAYR